MTHRGLGVRQKGCGELYEGSQLLSCLLSLRSHVCAQGPQVPGHLFSTEVRPGFPPLWL